MEITEKITKGLMACNAYSCKHCPYYENYSSKWRGFCMRELHNDILRQLTLEQPHVMEYEEMLDSDFAYLEAWYKDKAPVPVMPVTVDDVDVTLQTKTTATQSHGRLYYSTAMYGKKWRCWNKMPSEELRKETEWKQ